MDDLVAPLQVIKYDVVAITELWLKDSCSWELRVQGYTLYQRDRKVGREGGTGQLVNNGI